MKVTLIDYTGYGYVDPADRAATILLFTKNTRMNMTPGLMTEIAAWPAEKKQQELKYMAHTVPSSWEFVDYTFSIESVTRAFTHQLVRTRTASYAQQAMRVLDMSSGPGWSYATGPTISAFRERQAVYDEAMKAIDEAYKQLIAMGAAVEDARGLLPTNILTNICMNINMRAFVDLVQKRRSSRVQDEYRAVVNRMVDCVTNVHPFISLFLERTADQAAADLRVELGKLPDKKQSTDMNKLVDLMVTRS